MRTRLNIAVLPFALAVSGPAFGQQPPPAPATSTQPAGGGVPQKVDDRSYWPKNGIYDPALLIGTFFFYDAAKKEIVPLLRVPPSGGVSTTRLQPRTAYHYSLKKGDSAQGGLMGIVSGGLSDDEIIDLTITDVAETAQVSPDASLYCKYWTSLQSTRDWQSGDQLHYIWHATESVVNSKHGKKHDLSAKIEIGNYFSAGANEYSQQGDETLVPAIAYDSVYSTLTPQVIVNGCRTQRVPAPKPSKGIKATSLSQKLPAAALY